jgi:hypothetical protein
MLPIDKCKKLLPSGSYTEEEVEKIRDELNALASLLVKSYIERCRQPTDGLMKEKQNEKAG